MADQLSLEEYTRKVLDSYRITPGTTGNIRRPDRLLAAQLHQRGVPLRAVENALLLAVSDDSCTPPRLFPWARFVLWLTLSR